MLNSTPNYSKYYDLTPDKVAYKSGLRLPVSTEFVAKDWLNNDHYRVLAIANTHSLPKSNRMQHFVHTEVVVNR